MGSGDLPVERLLVGVCGAAAILSLPSYLVTLRAELAAQIRVIMTKAATSMLQPSTVALLSGGVFVDERPALEKKPGHVELAGWCELFVVVPATANGLAPDLLTTTVLASPRPVVFCPNVNAVMWNKPAVQRNVETLRADGHVVIHPELAPAYEVDTGETRDTWVVPAPDRLVGLLQEVLRRPEFSGS
jgi:phosphopantothenoylcysteine synthetase/decarboxylase